MLVASGCQKKETVSSNAAISDQFSAEKEFNGIKITLDEKMNCLVLRMRSVSAIDATAMHNLEQLYTDCKKKNIQIILSHVGEQPMHVMEKSGFLDKVGRENVCAHIDDALERAARLG